MRASRHAALLLLGTCITAWACLDRGPEDLLGNSAPDPLGRQQWSVILADSASGVWIAQTESPFAIHAESPSQASADLWTALDSEPAICGAIFSAQIDGRRMQWTLTTPDGASIGSGSGALFSYVGRNGAPRFAGNASITSGGRVHNVRFDAIGGLPMPDTVAVTRPPPPPHRLGAPGIVSLRIDDCGALDTASLTLLERHHLVASFAVPSRLVGRPTSCSPAVLARMMRDGDAIESHSRLHAAAPPTFADFYLETIGSLRDLESLGYHPEIFVAPGSWNSGPAFFDSPAKLDTPYGALLRRAYRAVEAYQTSEPAVAIPASGRAWPYAGEIHYYSVERLSAVLHDAAASGQWVELMWHSGDQLPAALDARLAVVEALRDSGLVENLTFRDALFADH